MLKNVIPFTKEITFDNKISEITSISLEENYNCTEDTIDGEFIVSGDYKTHELSVNKESFSYKLPFSVDLTEKIIPDTLNFEITDFSYDILNDNILKVNIEFSFDAKRDESTRDYASEVEELLNNDSLEEPKIEEKIEVENEDRLDKEDENTIIDSIKEDDNEYITYHIHVVKESETVESICAMYKTNANLIAEYNDLNDFKVGEKLIIVEEDEPEYNFIIRSNIIHSHFKCKAKDLTSALELAKKEAIKYSKDYTIGLNKSDLQNHIDEILNYLYKGE